MAGLLALLMVDSAIACRCAERELADYFAGADTVVAGMIETVERPATASGPMFSVHYRAVGDAWKGEQFAGQRGRVLTSTSSAGCGLNPNPGEFWVLFLSSEPGSLATACAGSRNVGPPSGSGLSPAEFDQLEIFKGVPRRNVAQQLNALSGLEELTRLQDSQSPRLLGLIDIKGLAHGASVNLHAMDSLESELVATIDGLDSLKRREAHYEFSAAEVYQANAFGYQLQLADGRVGWLHRQHAGTWFPYPELAVNRLNYLTEDWAGFLWPDLGAGIPLRLSTGERANFQRPARVTASATLADSLWLKVDMLNTDGCDGLQPKVLASGWTPAWGVDGQPVAWFHSRGC